jgi:hypothetical protein
MVLRMLPPRRLPTILDFGSVSGLRLNECLLEWSQVNWDVRKIEKQGNHADKYADLIDEVAADLDPMQKSRRKSRKPTSKVG